MPEVPTGDPPRLGVVKKSRSWPSIAPSRTSKSRIRTNSFFRSSVYTFILGFSQQTASEHLQNARQGWVRIKDESVAHAASGPCSPEGRQLTTGCSSQHLGETSTVAEVKYLITCGRMDSAEE